MSYFIEKRGSSSIYRFGWMMEVHCWLINQFNKIYIIDDWLVTLQWKWIDWRWKREKISIRRKQRDGEI